MEVENIFAKTKCAGCGTKKPNIPEEDIIQKKMLESMVTFDGSREKLRFEANFLLDESRFKELVNNGRYSCSCWISL